MPSPIAPTPTQISSADRSSDHDLIVQVQGAREGVANSDNSNPHFSQPRQYPGMSKPAYFSEDLARRLDTIETRQPNTTITTKTDYLGMAAGLAKKATRFGLLNQVHGFTGLGGVVPLPKVASLGTGAVETAQLSQGAAAGVIPGVPAAIAKVEKELPGVAKLVGGKD